VALVSALLGGILGERFHRAVDRAALEEPEVPAEAEDLTAAEAEDGDITEVEEEPNSAEESTRALS
jgi:hypothetical protein